ncbi:MAG: 5-bromo-4-chloroindolyl phosphate hydrolysis family protein [Turicibacter sp.]|nr:5-bromo-4-chloroindolyl phosphate hydrolysis family protein [Turicibacter sp.]
MKDIFSNIEQQIENIDAKIESIVENVTESQNYEKLNQKINDMVNSSSHAFEKGYAKAERVVKDQTEKFKTATQIQQEKLKQHTEEFQQTSTKQPSESGLFAKKGGVHAGGLSMAIVGFIFTVLSGVGILVMTFMSAILLPGVWTTINRFLLVPGFAIFLSIGCIGILMMNSVARFRKYVQTIGNKTYADVANLSSAVRKSDKFTRRDIKKMIRNNWFKEGRLTHDELTLIVSRATYQEYEANRQREVAAQKKEAHNRQIHEQLPVQAQTILIQGEDFIEAIKKHKGAITDPDTVMKLSQLELILKKIFKRVKERPDIVPATRKMMDYYLPTTVKLLEAYAQLEKQAIQGTNIVAAKTEIKDSLDTLVSAYEKLLDDLFEDVMLDVSTDISVLNTMLAQDGLTDGELGSIKNDRGDE